MNPRLTISTVLILGLLMACAPLRAHHGNSAYDEEHPITINGTVTEFVWSNPHCQIYMTVKDAKGKDVTWAIESQSPGILRRNNWTRSSIKPGDQIEITLAAAKNRAPVGFSGGKTGKIVFSDGRVLRMAER
jgi:uncharacterized protein DUF6152